MKYARSATSDSGNLAPFALLDLAGAAFFDGVASAALEGVATDFRGAAGLLATATGLALVVFRGFAATAGRVGTLVFFPIFAGAIDNPEENRGIRPEACTS
ncbi:MAG: hypothetical protein JWQ44_2163 [Chthoniobacter sp.]|nr:hypothetical protein [Chthoniobacter sp.]